MAVSQRFDDVAARDIRVSCEREVAFESPDHLMPWGTRMNNSRNHRFNEKLYRLFVQKQSPLTVLDMGCSGGGFVKDCIDDGCIAVGLEGSDFSKRFRRAEWRTIPEYLFTCDVTGNFEVLVERSAGRERLLFDVVTCWEMMEHLTEEGIDKVAANVGRHLAPGGIWVASVSPLEEVINGVRLHQTVQPREWWIRKFVALGFHHVEGIVEYFNTQFIRGPKYDGQGSFILALSPDPARAPKPPKERLSVTIYDKWLGSRAQRVLRRFVVGS